MQIKKSRLETENCLKSLTVIELDLNGEYLLSIGAVRVIALLAKWRRENRVRLSDECNEIPKEDLT